MISKSEIRFAARLVHLGLVNKEDMQAVLHDLDKQRMRSLDSSLDDILVERGHITKTEIPLIKEKDEAPSRIQVRGFRVLNMVGEGGMSRVYRAVPTTGRVPLALKILRPHIARNAAQVRRFYKEAEMLIRFDHAHLVKGKKVWDADGLHCFAMEYVDGVSVLDEIENGHLFQETEALAIVLQAARALDYLQQQGITHRDVKPGNLLRDRKGTTKLIDLGLARTADPETTARPGTTVGTVQYVSPEQARGEDDLDVRADIYSLGVSLYHMVVGQVPFSGASDRDILRQQIFSSLKSPRSRDRRVTPHLHYFIEKMMAKDRALRYQEPAELIQDIEEKIQGREEIVCSTPPPPAKSTLRTTGRRSSSPRRSPRSRFRRR